ncbi:hypothetical protein DICPUDRAFT_82326 [Dictyostelium purpureum]|uniref:Enoyl reductase (ER) domain-containing protein n=1 Tax=Dictyostelium purpureum TaxID=5786 RepID=F0ZW72_DICPU|nr:uncharacterized protein DICPUDRAFT_82326 [Dictyostelium purpureum]EGC31799.1 hypothetical protein DICPUDRAFT_82326 [Dictyostelium purpureum]|eukprot:XP_003291666.1 hypothetical protein DICPUDRAFT_82326 [Dictyostelium purpureum]
MMKAAVFKHKGAEIEIVNMPIPEPKKGWIRIKVISCGVCSGDNVARFDGFGGTPYPIVPGHEVIGSIDKLGEDVDANKYKLGSLAGCGWFGGSCHKKECEDCTLEDQWVHCKESLAIGTTVNGGHSEYVVIPEDALVIIPDGMDPVSSSPLLCAGLTVFNSFKNQNIRKGALVGVQGIGGLGHLGIQFVKKMGYEVIAMSSGSTKKELAKELGADHYVDMSKDYVNEMKKIGSVKCILMTAPNKDCFQGLIDSLGTNGKLLVLGAVPESVNLNSLSLIGGNKSIVGWASGDSRQSLETLQYAHSNQVKPMVKEFKLEELQKALDTIGDARFRYVIKFN